MHSENHRTALTRLAGERGVSLAALSRMLGRNSAYIQQYIARGRPIWLDPDDRRRLAAFFDVEEHVLGMVQAARSTDLIHVSRLAVGASAGLGAMVNGEEAVGRFGFDPMLLRKLTRARPDELAIIKVVGDSMAPTLVDDDDLLVDQSAVGKRLRDGIYVLRRDDTLMVKRLAVAPMAATLTISSDNPAYPTWSNVPVHDVAVVGCAIWTGRKLS